MPYVFNVMRTCAVKTAPETFRPLADVESITINTSPANGWIQWDGVDFEDKGMLFCIAFASYYI